MASPPQSDDPSYGLIGPDPSANIYGGLLGGKVDPLLLNLGLGIIASGRYGGNLGVDVGNALNNYSQQRQAAMQNALGRQQLGMNALNMQFAQQTMPLKLGWLKAAGERLHIANNDPQLTKQLQAQAPSLWNGPQDSQASQTPSVMTIPSSVPAIPGAPTGFSNAPPIQAAPLQVPAQQTTPAQLPQQMPQQGGRGPFDDMDFATMGAVLGMPGTNEMIERAKAQLQYDPRVASQMEAAKSAVGVDQYQIQQALQQGNIPLAQALANGKYRQDLGLRHIAEYNGNVVDTNAGTGAISTFSPQTGIRTDNGIASLIPGMAGALQSKSAAEALGQAQGELVDVVDPVTHQTYRVPKSTLLPGGAGAAAPFSRGASAALPGAAATSAGSAGAPASGSMAALSPGQVGYLEERGKESAGYVKQLQDAADQATDQNYSLDQMIASAQRVKLGPAAGASEWMQNAAAAIGQPFGIDPPKELADYETLDKWANKVAFQATRTMGSREAAQIVTLEMKSNPNKLLVPDAFVGLAQSMKAMNNYMIAKNSAIQAQSGADNDGALQAASAWTSKIDPRVWALSLSPDLAAKFASSIGPAKIATALPAMAHEDGISVIRNIPQSMRPTVLSRLPLSVKQEILTGMQQSGATGSY